MNETELTNVQLDQEFNTTYWVTTDNSPFQTFFWPRLIKHQNVAFWQTSHFTQEMGIKREKNFGYQCPWKVHWLVLADLFNVHMLLTANKKLSIIFSCGQKYYGPVYFCDTVQMLVENYSTKVIWNIPVQIWQLRAH